VLIVLLVEIIRRYLPAMQWAARILMFDSLFTYNAWILAVFVADISTGSGGFHSCIPSIRLVRHIGIENVTL
jgi:hypothetical protein